jgi:hypothetical protein
LQPATAQRYFEIQRKGTHLSLTVGAHQLTALLHQFQGVFETENPGGNQRRVFAETVSCGDRGSQPVVGQLPEDLQARDGMGQQCRLRIPGEVELVLRVGKGKFGDVVTENITGLRIDIPGDSKLLVKVAAHARVLRPLAREDIEDMLFVVEHYTNTPRSLNQFT